MFFFFSILWKFITEQAFRHHLNSQGSSTGAVFYQHYMDNILKSALLHETPRILLDTYSVLKKYNFHANVRKVVKRPP